MDCRHLQAQPIGEYRDIRSQTRFLSRLEDIAIGDVIQLPTITATSIYIADQV